MTLTATFTPLPALDLLAARWQALEARAGEDKSFFLGWTWMESWLSTSGASPELLSVQSDGEDVVLALIGRAQVPRLLGGVATLSLNQAGVAAQDRSFIEYNGLLKSVDAPKGVEAVALQAMIARSDWSALQLAGVTPNSQWLDHGHFRRTTCVDRSPVYLIDLAAVRGATGDYLSLLSANTRSQIKRSTKDYGSDPTITATTDAVLAETWLGEMQALNMGRHADNAWEDSGFRSFARALVLRGLKTGEVELLRITAGEHLLGYLLNFLYAGRAMNYQSAFSAPISSKAKPGLMCHAAAVARYADAGIAIYSLLAGKDRYKQSLATGEEALEWWTLERFSPRLEAEALLRRIFRRPASA